MSEQEQPDTLDLRKAIIHERSKLSRSIKRFQAMEKVATPPVVQELVLARRHQEDTRMRLGVALTLLDGKDPWDNGSQSVSKQTVAEEK